MAAVTEVQPVNLDLLQRRIALKQMTKSEDAVATKKRHWFCWGMEERPKMP
ncbi:MAG: hypothetical protein R3C44_00735 [Chloroflexota bacterium]